jgi:uncharacterized protein (TIGR02246 family)
VKRQGISVIAMSAAGLAAIVSGCSTRIERGIGSAPAEPEFRAAAEPGRTIAPGLVPVVIAQPHPFRSAEPLRHAAAEPRRLAAAQGRAIGDTEASVRGMINAYQEAFNRHDAVELAAHWATAGENVDLASGDVTQGRDAVRGVFSALFADDTAAAIEIDVAAVRPVRADVAVVDGTSRITFGDGATSGSRFSAVAVRQSGRWMFESVRESPWPEASTAPRELEQLGWLVGMWEDVGPGITAGTTCHWTTGRGFLVRRHVVTGGGGVAEPSADVPGLLPPGDVAPREVTEIIGWDPERGQLRSWVFTAAGRFAEGTWTREGDAWRVRLDGRGGDMGRSCEFVVGHHGGDGLTVRGSADGLAADLVPVCDFVRTAR